MRCKKCGSENVNVQAVTHVSNKGKGCMYWILIGWWLELFMWMFLTLPMLIIQIFKPKKVKSRTHSEAVCQNCGYRRKI